MAIPTLKQIEGAVAEMTREALGEITAAKNKISFGKAVLSNLSSPEESAELRKVFRNIAKALHPDINPNLTPDQKEVWHQFQEAYNTGDLELFKALEIVYADVVAAAEREPKELSAEKKQLESDFPFSLADKLHDEEWVAEKQQAVIKDIEEYNAALAEKTADYELIKETYER